MVKKQDSVTALKGLIAAGITDSLEEDSSFDITLFVDLLPQNSEAWDETVNFLNEVFAVLLDYIQEQNNRDTKILDFYHPDEMKKLINLSIPQNPLPLDSLVKVMDTNDQNLDSFLYSVL